MYRYCAACNTIMPAREYVGHMRGHRDRQGSTTAWRKLRELVLARDRHRCRHPGCSATTSLEVHHVIPVAQGGQDRPENLLTLCSAHHGEAHHGAPPQAA
jgi:5-methylcytosine-specific restriction endonuclease McrA